MTSIKARLNCSYMGKDGMYPLGIQVIHSRAKCIISTPYRLKLTEFDDFSEKASTDKRHRKRAAEIREINAYITDLKKEVEQVVLSLGKQGKFTTNDIVHAFKIHVDKNNFFAYAESKIAEIKSAGRYSMASNYLSAINAFERYLGSRDLSLDNITKSTIEGFMDFQKQGNKKPSTVVFYVRQLRSIFNKADDDGFVHTDWHPFYKIKTKAFKTTKRAISMKELNMIAELDLEGQHKHKELARDLFRFSLFTCGMAFVDMCYLKKENIHGEMLVYRRRKTGQEHQVRIEPSLRMLLQKYEDDNSDYLLPMLRTNDSYNNYRYMQRCLNKRIHELGVELQFDFPLTFYVARYTWATLARDKGFPVSAISAGMGHTSEMMTQTYFSKLDHQIVDEANRAVINCWGNGNSL